MHISSSHHARRGHAPHGLPAWGIGVVKLRQHIDRASAVEVVADGARAADGNLVARVVPAIEGCSLAGRAVVVEHPHDLLILPHSEARVALLPLYPLASSECTDLRLGYAGHSSTIATDGAAAADASLLQRVEDGRGSEPIVGEEDVLLLLVACESSA